MAERKVIMNFDSRYLELQEELKYHPALCVKLNKTSLDIRDKLSCFQYQHGEHLRYLHAHLFFGHPDNR